MEMRNNLVNKNRLNGISLPIFFLGLYFVLFPLDFLPTELGSVSRILAILPVGFAIVFNFTHIKIDIMGFSLIVCYLFLNLISAYYCEIPSQAMERTLTLGLNFAMIVVCSSLQTTDKEKKFLVKSLVLSGWFLLFLSLFFGSEIDGGRLVIIIKHVHQDPNYFCGYMIFAIMYYLENILKKERILFSIFSLGIMLLLIFLTGSRSGLLAVSLSALFFVLFYRRNKHTIYKMITIGILLVIAYFLLMNFIPDDVKMRFTIRYTSVDGGAGRFTLWEELINKYNNNFSVFEQWFGKGAGNITNISDHGKVAHSLWLEHLIELGRVGVILIIGIYLYFIRKAYLLKDKLYLFTLTGYVIMAFSLSLCAYKPIFAIFIMINLFSEQQRGQNLLQIISNQEESEQIYQDRNEAQT